jgi:hypothetical protein
MIGRYWHQPMVFAFLILLPFASTAQWYQGASGGRGGKPFDHWKATNGARDISSIGFYVDSSVRCIFVNYRDGNRQKSGYCDPGPGPLTFDGGRGINLAPDEYILGISGRFGDHIDSIRIYTNKITSPVFGGNGGTDVFSYTAPEGQMIVGFFGRAGDNLDAIGVLYAPCTPQKKPCR